jgi:hypothetical protein
MFYCSYRGAHADRVALTQINSKTSKETTNEVDEKC